MSTTPEPTATLDLVAELPHLLRTEHAKLLDKLTDPLGRVSVRRNELQYELNIAILNALTELNRKLLAAQQTRNAECRCTCWYRACCVTAVRTSS